MLDWAEPTGRAAELVGSSYAHLALKKVLLVKKNNYGYTCNKDKSKWKRPLNRSQCWMNVCGLEREKEKNRERLKQNL